MNPRKRHPEGLQSLHHVLLATICECEPYMILPLFKAPNKQFEVKNSGHIVPTGAVVHMRMCLHPRGPSRKGCPPPPPPRVIHLFCPPDCLAHILYNYELISLMLESAACSN